MSQIEAKTIIGVDEAGRGPLAGPVVAAAVCLPADFSHEKITDSKKLSPAKREQLFSEITSLAIAYKIVAVGPRRIEKINIREATKLAMSLAVQPLSGDLVLIDGNMPINTNLPQQTVIGGDRLNVQISAASILAKVYRDRLMRNLASLYPHYKFEKHAGYGTKDHLQFIAKHGPCRAHRRTFAGVKEYLDYNFNQQAELFSQST